ncbi:MAG: translocation/assembly module TamB domain-containing protein [Pseudomonadota bacterium]
MAKGSLQGKAEDLSPVSAVLGEHVGGSAEIKTRFVPGKVGQDILLHLKGQEVISRLGQAGEVELAAHITDILKSPRGTAEVRIETFQRDDLMLKAIEMTATGNGKKVAFEGHARGRRGEEFEVQARGNVDISEKIQRIRLDVFKGHYGGYPVALARPATVLRFSEGFAVEGVSLKLGSGRLEVSGNLRGDEVAFVATLEAFPLEVLSLIGYPGFVGLAAGRLRMMGSPEHPEASVDIQLTGVLPSAAEFRELPPVTITVHAMLRERLLRATLLLEGLAEKPAEASIQLPVVLTLLPPSLSLPAKAELQGRLAGEVNLNIIPILLHMEDQKCEGHLAIDLGLGGSMDTPEVTGLARVEKANYENIRTGTILRDVNILIKAKNHRIELEQAHAIDGETGTVSAKGRLDLIPARGFPLQINVNLDKSMLFRRDDLTASVSGEVTLSGSLSDLTIGGKLTVGPGEIRIPDSLPPEVVELEVVEINLPITGGRPKGVPRRTQSFRLNLDLDISLPGRVFMRGRGLDSEWRGELHITGSPHEPVISGDLSVTRGHVNLFGKRFVLTQGTLTMYGTAPHSIKLDVIGENRMGGMTVRIRLSGDLSALQVNMESEPPLPSEEVLSHLLFRRSAARISPLQALQLAQAVKALVGGSMGVFDLMGYTRDLLGVDQLAVIQSDETEGKTSVSVGKYVGEDVYVEVGKGVGTFGGKVSVELEVAPNITVESEVGTNAQPGIGLNWKWDY